MQDASRNVGEAKGICSESFEPLFTMVVFEKFYFQSQINN